MRARVAIVQRRLVHYRVPLFERLRDELAGYEIALRLLHGRGTPAEESKQDGAQLDWAEALPTRYLLKDRLCWQPYAGRVRDCDLVVVTQENKLLNNLPPLFGLQRPPRLAFWGHGRNMQAANPDAPSERFKRWTTQRVDWWFAYTRVSRERIEADGFDPARITQLDNAIDTRGLQTAVQAARQQPAATLRASLGLPPGPLLLYLGSLYAEKRIDWLLQTARRLGQVCPAATLAVAGAGPQQELVQSAGLANLRYLGAVHGEAKARLLASADLLLSPGAVGLVVLDAFAAGLPLLTTSTDTHGPEVAYLVHGQNSLLSADRQQDFEQACIGLLNDPAQRQLLARGATEAAAHYSIEGMAQRFSEGIRRCLARQD